MDGIRTTARTTPVHATARLERRVCCIRLGGSPREHTRRPAARAARTLGSASAAQACAGDARNPKAIKQSINQQTHAVWHPA